MSGKISTKFKDQKFKSLRRQMRRFINIYQCLECGITFANYATKYCRCNNCGSEDYLQIAPAWSNVEYLDQADDS
jgi:predicted Zn-ribbon and HTH transcriptional regulator